MAAIAVRNLTFTYPSREKPALSQVFLDVDHGEFVVLCGSSGSGKSTLLRNLKPSLSPHGTREGEILFYGQPLDSLSKREQAARIGYVLQNPDNQLVTDKVWHELAFGLESLGYDTNTIRLRVAEMANFFDIQTWFHRNVSELSGGQKQLLNLAAVMVMQPDVLILDEPTSQLDPVAAGEFLETVRKINREIGTTVILSEHRLEEVFPLADRALVLDHGALIADDIPENVSAMLAAKNHPMFRAMPAPLIAYSALYAEGIRQDLPCPLTVREGRRWLSGLLGTPPLPCPRIPVPEQRACNKDKPAVSLKEVWFRYNKNDPDVIKDLSLSVYPGEFFCIVGGNGSGKTTALRLIAGQTKPWRGKLSQKSGAAAMLPQNPQSIFLEKNLRLDLLEILENSGLSADAKDAEVLRIAALLELEDLLEMHPYDLSGGEQQRAALGKILLRNPEVLLLDEPTKGLDAQFKEKLAEILKKLLTQGTTIIAVSHDIEFCARHADRCAMFFDGNIVTENIPNRFFSGNSFYTTAANRMSRHLFENAVTSEDVIRLCHDNLRPHGPETPEGSEGPERPSNPAAPEPSGKAPEKRRSLTNLSMAVLMPVTIVGGMFFLEDRKYYFISLMMVLYAMVPFLLSFERRKPKAREMIVIAVMIALAVAGRAAFFMVPSFKPMIALIILAGVCLGAESGFIVGALSGFISNFLFGQGPWTPWQMFALGIIGFAAGLLVQKKLLGTGRRTLMAFGALAAFFLYGGIVDLWTVLGMTYAVNKESALTIYTLALPFNLIHAASTAFFLYFIASPMTEKLNRMKTKYGMF